MTHPLRTRYSIYFDDPGLINQVEVKYRAVTPEDIERVSRTFLVKSRRNVITTLPKKKPSAGDKG